MIKMRKQPTDNYNPWNELLMPGQRVYDKINNKMYDLYESNGWGKRSLGELVIKEPLAQKQGKIPIQVDGIWYWK